MAENVRLPNLSNNEKSVYWGALLHFTDYKGQQPYNVYKQLNATEQINYAPWYSNILIFVHP